MKLNALKITNSAVQGDLLLALSKAEKTGFLNLIPRLYSNMDGMVERLYFKVPMGYREAIGAGYDDRGRAVRMYDSFVSVDRRIAWIKEAKHAPTQDVHAATLG